MDDVAAAVAVKHDLIGERPRMRRSGRTDVNDTEASAGRFEKPAPAARAAPPEAHESLISRKTGAEVPLTGLFFVAHIIGENDDDVGFGR